MDGAGMDMGTCTDTATTGDTDMGAMDMVNIFAFI